LSLLLFAIVIGAAAGLARAQVNGQRYEIADLHHLWLVPVAILPQFFAFQLPATRSQMSIELAATALVSSQALLLFFAWSNRERPGFLLLGLGLALNFVVIVLNGGLMPISPETISRLIPELPSGTWPAGERFGTGKDIVLIATDTKLWWLSDRIILPAWLPFRAAFSIGDFVIAAGASWFFCFSGRRFSKANQRINKLEYEG